MKKWRKVTTLAVLIPMIVGGAMDVATIDSFAANMGAQTMAVNATQSISDGWYYIKSVSSQKYLTVNGNNAGANVELRTGDGSTSQKWKLTGTGDGYFTLTSGVGDFMMDVSYGKDEDGANIGIYNAYSGDAQRYVAQKTNTDGIYTIGTKASNGTKVLDVYEKRTADGTNIVQWTRNAGTNQQFIFEAVSGQNTQPSNPGPSNPQPSNPQPSNPQPSNPSTGGEQSASGIVSEYKVSGDWGSGFQGELVVTNKTGSAIANWTITFDMDAEINSLWGAELVGKSGKTVTVKHNAWDSTLANNASVNIGFVANGSSASKPSNVKMNDIAANAGGSSSGSNENQGGNTQQPGNQGGNNEQQPGNQGGNNEQQPGNQGGNTEQPGTQPNTGTFVYTSYPTIYADVPDLDIINQNGTYYMISTTMNLCPGVPVMKSTDLVHWKIVNYVYDILENDDITNLNNGKSMYSHGSWAASLKYDDYSKTYYVAFNSNDHGFYIYTTKDIENGKWEKHKMTGSFHDPALFFENGNMYVISASGKNCIMQQLRLNGSRVERVGSQRTLFSQSNWGLWEGAHAIKVNGTYYIFIIASPSNRWMRTQLCYKSNSLTGRWEEKVVFQSGVGRNSAGLAQGSILQAADGKWYGFMFQDMGAVGRAPSIVAVEWQNGWPMMGTYDDSGRFHANTSALGMRLGVYDSGAKNEIVDSDEFSSDQLKLVWQWNHNPQNQYWSLTKNPGYLRLTTDRTVSNIFEAHNSLTQRTVGPTFTSETKLYTDNMKPGDYAGLCAVADHYGMVGVMCNDRGERYVYQANANFKTAFRSPNATSYQKIPNGSAVYLKISYSFGGYPETASFSYSFDGRNWTPIGNRMNLGFSTSTTFMGTRTWLFNYATKQAGGYVDFDYYKIGN